MRIVLADDDENIRSALGLLLEQEPDVEVIGTAENANNLLDLIDRSSSKALPCEAGSTKSSGPASETKLLFLDWELPGWIADKHLGCLRQNCPGLIVIALSVGPDDCQMAIEAGADAYVCKSDPPDLVLRTVRQLTSTAH